MGAGCRRCDNCHAAPSGIHRGSPMSSTRSRSLSVRISALALGLLASGVALADAHLDPKPHQEAVRGRRCRRARRRGELPAVRASQCRAAGGVAGARHREGPHDAHAADRRRAGDAIRDPRAAKDDDVVSIYWNARCVTSMSRRTRSAARPARSRTRVTSDARFRSAARASAWSSTTPASTPRTTTSSSARTWCRTCWPRRTCLLRSRPRRRARHRAE